MGYRATLRLVVVVFVSLATSEGLLIAQDAPTPDSKSATAQSSPDVETIVIFRHGEKPAKGLGQLTPQGFNRAIALSTLLPHKFGKPDFLFAPDPGEMVSDYGVKFNYVRPLATIEPTAIALGMPVYTPCGFHQIDQLDDELSKPKYARSVIFVAWEHGYAGKAAADLVKRFGGDEKTVPGWPGPDFDSLYVVKITRTTDGHASVEFTHDHEGLDGQSKSMPTPAPVSDSK
jgi:hypothetical protein